MPVAVLALILGLIRLPYFVVRPGPAHDVVPLIRIEDHPTYPGRGKLLLTSVLFFRPNVYEVLAAWVDPAESVVPERDILAPGVDEEQERQVALSQMDTSKIHAAYVVLEEYTDYPQSHGPGALVESVFPGTPAEGRLFPGDLIVQVDGERVDGLDGLQARIRAAGEGTPLTFVVEAGGRTRTVRIAPALVPEVTPDRPVIGVGLVENFPFPLIIESGNIGGPSAGLMWTLGLVELLTPEDLTAGMVIAGTGEITLDGEVLPISGIQEKVLAAEDAGAAVFFAPLDNTTEARAVADDIAVVPVETFMDAVRYLERQG